MAVIIGMDPHKRSATIEVVDERAQVLAVGRFGTDKSGYAEMLAACRRHPDRVWAIEGCNGIGKHIAHRLVHDGETVVDVPPKLSAQVRVRHRQRPQDRPGRRALGGDGRTAHPEPDPGPRRPRAGGDGDAGRPPRRARPGPHADDQPAAPGVVGAFPGGAKPFLSSHQARVLIATIKPRDIVGKTRRRLAVELIGELEAIDKKIKTAEKDLKALVVARGSTLMDVHGIGPSGAARLLADVGDIRRFADRDRFASWNGTAPLDASSADQTRHRLSRAGNRRINRALHIMAVVQLRNATEGRAYFDAKRAAGKTSMEAMRTETTTLERRLRTHGRGPEATCRGGPGRATGNDN